MTARDIRVVCAAIVRDGALLCVRKEGTDLFMLPGGKPEAGEDGLATLHREVTEELGCGLHPGSARLLGQYAAPAAHEAGCTVRADIWRADLSGAPRAQAEIAELRWVDLHDRTVEPVLAPLLRTQVMPLLRQS
ncbi:NUDIX domain-containing protein [Gluconacetobacter entanii]|uniref:NUDIX domain-containing protein n=1 Tax=Gluconacetobacter entanii TaxID=108528 RepID=A0ABT3K6A9_9PROT|nr:NUDIX domain-containing protein [Gluconacetobacter entanii]MCW4590919.1 NUDIX domain-containing protein [Gluconacetobacter entanii]MCW4594412.1 NUDIX domain-containing protein [Gluconacetobacter entanii]NPC90029.1 NUDIX domain-containing protein [Gluconacetobacter entanii]